MRFYGDPVNHRDEVRTFLTTRRGRIPPEPAALPVYGRTSRRVPGLRRGEPAQLAGVSVEYYSRLERGDISGVSDGVLEALARALRLDESERAIWPIRPGRLHPRPADRSGRRRDPPGHLHPHRAQSRPPLKESP
ncbi:hypothetical protein GCM10022223_14890 [Kineosporia mesophila]|uniref:HTH cro/C1-type domain-containing protein n=1 Tax=Kineosporia mesophila TaxID=566012 RepID=A0ABP6Z6Y0_9ACTN|nr:helix-turn-helix transcriptional regulator [Kineosporia mesophila]